MSFEAKQTLVLKLTLLLIGVCPWPRQASLWARFFICKIGIVMLTAKSLGGFIERMYVKYPTVSSTEEALSASMSTHPQSQHWTYLAG